MAVSWGMKKAATDAVCGGFTPPLLQTTRGAAVQSTGTQYDDLLRTLDFNEEYNHGVTDGRAAAAIRALAADLSLARAKADDAESRIARAKAVADDAGLINWEESNYAAGAASVSAALEETK